MYLIWKEILFLFTDFMWDRFLMSVKYHPIKEVGSWSKHFNHHSKESTMRFPDIMILYFNDSRICLDMYHHVLLQKLLYQFWLLQQCLGVPIFLHPWWLWIRSIFFIFAYKTCFKKNSHCVDISSIIKAIERIFTCLLAISMNRLFASFVQRFCSVCLF